MPESKALRIREFGVLGEVGNIRLMCEGYGAPGQLETFERLRALSIELKGVGGISWARLILWWFYEVSANYRACDEIIAQIESGTEIEADHETARHMSAYVAHLGTE